YNRENVGGAFLGIFRGVYHGVGRTVSGAGELTGFWAADPDNNDRISIPLDAEYAWEEGTHYSCIDPDFGEATLAPIGNKLLRGLGNALFGVIEVPGQIAKGINEKAPDAGIVKGIWFFLSREMDGAVDVASFFLPNPPDNKGYPFDEKWPWSAMGDCCCAKK
ncbi:MAG TPA: hypothetical protein PKG81_02050, partial [Candidatus Omnitrophota bacterium]|nr:hypothetical protein [Candidatus Omnitrophota bacterium]